MTDSAGPGPWSTGVVDRHRHLAEQPDPHRRHRLLQPDDQHLLRTHHHQRHLGDRRLLGPANWSTPVPSGSNYDVVRHLSRPPRPPTGPAPSRPPTAGGPTHLFPGQPRPDQHPQSDTDVRAPTPDQRRRLQQLLLRRDGTRRRGRRLRQRQPLRPADHRHGQQRRSSTATSPTPDCSGHWTTGQSTEAPEQLLPLHQRGTNDSLGLIANNYVEVNHPVTNAAVPVLPSLRRHPGALCDPSTTGSGTGNHHRRRRSSPSPSRSSSTTTARAAAKGR